MGLCEQYWERIDAKTAARCSPPATDDYYLARMYMASFFSDMSRRPSKLNKDTMHCHRGVKNQSNELQN